MRLVHRTLRGRYRLAALLALLLASAGGTVGYFAVPAEYMSTGLVQIESVIPAILYTTPENQVPPMFEAYVASQAAYLHSWKLLAAAIDRPEMAEAGWPVGPKGVSALDAALTVKRARGEHTIFVSVADRSPHMAQTAVNAVLTAYHESDPQPAGLSLEAKEQLLVRREESLEGQLQTLRQRIMDYSEQYGHIPIKQIHASKAAELIALEHKHTQTQIARGERESAVPLRRIGRDFTSIFSIADSTISPLQEKELALVAEIKSAQTRYRSSHPIFRKLVRQLGVIRTQKGLRLRALESAVSDLSIPIPDTNEQIEDRYTKLRDQLLKEAIALGEIVNILAAMEEQVVETKQRLLMTQRRLDEIRFEAGRENADRITIVNGGLPGWPSSDRRVGLAGAGMMFGAAVGVTFVVLIGLRDRRIRYVDVLEAMGLPLPIVGLMPVLAGSAPVPAVVQLRNLLQLQRSAPERNVHVLTSCDQSEDRTKVAFALAVSFADAGHKTLLIDASFDSPLLSRKLELAKRPGLREALGTGNGNSKFHQTRHANLLIMPIGAILGVSRKDFTKQVVRRLYDDLRNRYDTIIVDAGPVSCDFDACLIAAEADQVVMIVDRNQERDQVRKAVSRLAQLGINTAGLLFNGAPESDVSSVNMTDFGTLTADGSSAGAHSPSGAASHRQRAA